MPSVKTFSRKCVTVENIAKVAKNEQFKLFRFLATGNTRHLLCNGFFKIYRNNILTEEFNDILSRSDECSKILGKEMNFAPKLSLNYFG